VIEVDDIVNDPDLSESFTITRTTGTYQIGGWVKNVPQVIQAYGAVRNTSGKEIEMVPEADRIKNTLTFRSTVPMFETNEANNEISDILTFHGDDYRILAVKDYSSQGYYLAVATIMGGA